MTDVIKLLPDTVANQIAAGEVIQRPASVVKELVENAIDAGATHIKVVVVDAGKTSLQVVDDGCGMTDTDARLAFERHATSKIAVATDLFALHTMGFRGEALPSIAAVAQVELRTRREDAEVGTVLHIEGGKVLSQEPTACAQGANFIVRNLFFNIPARRKFLKSNATEMTNILTEFERIALAHPGVAFTLYNGDVVAMQLPAGSLRQRIVNIFGKRFDAHLLPVEVDTPLAHITGFVGTPESARKKMPNQFFFANGRFMRHPYFAKAVLSAYDRLIPDGFQVPFFIRFEVAPDCLDVNIHPQKTEIKFQDEQSLWQILLAGVREALGKFNAIPTLDFDTENKPAIPSFQSDNNNVHQPTVHINSSFNPFESSGMDSAGSAALGWDDSFTPVMPAQRAVSGDDAFPEEELGGYHLPSDGVTPEGLSSSQYSSGGGSREQGVAVLWQEAEPSVSAPDSTVDAVVQYQGRYIIATTPSGILLVDQQRAHQRLLYNGYMVQLRQRQGVAQGLLFPQLLELSPSSATLLTGLLPRLTDVGFDISPLGGNSFSIMGIPAGTEGLDPVKLLEAIIAEADEGSDSAAETTLHHIAATLAAQAAMPIGQALTESEMVDMVGQLLHADSGNYTPDGRPTQCLLSPEKLDQFFK